MKFSLPASAIFLPVTMLCLALPVQAASFDCTKASGALEKAICASPQLGVQDEEIAMAYRHLLGSVSTPWDELVKKSQREWLRARSAEMADLKGKELDDALQTSMRNRLDALNGALIIQNGMHLLAVDRAVMQKVAPDRVAYAQGQQQVTQTSSLLYLLDDVPGAKRFNALIDKTFAQMLDATATAEGEYDLSAELNFASPELVSVNLGSSEFGFGAAHPVAGTRQLNFLLAEGRLLRVHDLFTGRGHEDLILRNATQAFAEAGLKPLASVREARALLLDPRNWALDARGLTVVVPPDSLFAHVDGSPEVPPVLWKSFQGQLTPLAEKIFGK